MKKGKIECGICEENKRRGNPVIFKKKHTRCSVCKKEVRKVLDLHHTNANLCSIKCEQRFWLDILC